VARIRGKRIHEVLPLPATPRLAEEAEAPLEEAALAAAVVEETPTVVEDEPAAAEETPAVEETVAEQAPAEEPVTEPEPAAEPPVEPAAEKPKRRTLRRKKDDS